MWKPAERPKTPQALLEWVPVLDEGLFFNPQSQFPRRLRYPRRGRMLSRVDGMNFEIMGLPEGGG